VLPADISNVMVLSPSLMGEDVSPIWSQPGALERAIAMVVAGGDSLTQRAVSSIAAEQARRDSLDADRTRQTADSAAAATATSAPPARADSVASPRPLPASPPLIRPPSRRDTVRRP
jgi:hypothetical protein